MNEIIYGKSVVKEAINQKRKINQLYVLENLNEIIEIAKKNNLKYKVVNKDFLNNLTSGLHQGVVANVEGYKYYTLEEVVNNIDKPLPFLVVLDGLEDPHNLGAVLRTSDAAGVDGVILPKNRSVHLNSTVAKVSTGAIEHVKVIEVVNLVNALKKLKKMGYWIVGAEATKESTVYSQMKYDMPIVLVIGSEGKGISRLVKEECDFLVKIPMVGHVNSLNASVSAGILIYEVVKYR